jgi:endonuclease YncB( thermonuclease family)
VEVTNEKSCPRITQTVLRSLMWRNTDNSLRPRWRFLALIGLLPLLALAQTAPPAQPFQRLDGCAYKPQRWDDGDSFHVILPDQKELIFRLYFVDTP